MADAGSLIVKIMAVCPQNALVIDRDRHLWRAAIVATDRINVVVETADTLTVALARVAMRVGINLAGR